MVISNSLCSKNVTINGQRTSLRLEREIWDALDEVCVRESLSLHELCSLIEKFRHISNRTSAVRAFIISYFRSAATDDGHSIAGHGTLDRAFGKAVDSSGSWSSVMSSTEVHAFDR